MLLVCHCRGERFFSISRHRDLAEKKGEERQGENTIQVSIRGFDPCLYVTRHYMCLECTYYFRSEKHFIYFEERKLLEISQHLIKERAQCLPFFSLLNRFGTARLEVVFTCGRRPAGLLVTLVVVVVVVVGGITFLHGLSQNSKAEPDIFFIFQFQKPMYGLIAHVWSGRGVTPHSKIIVWVSQFNL